MMRPSICSGDQCRSRINRAASSKRRGSANRGRAAVRRALRRLLPWAVLALQHRIRPATSQVPAAIASLHGVRSSSVVKSKIGVRDLGRGDQLVVVLPKDDDTVILHSQLE